MSCKIGLIRFVFEDMFNNETCIYILPTRNGSFSVPFQYTTGEWDIISGRVDEKNKVSYTIHGYLITHYKFFGLEKRQDYVVKKLQSQRYEAYELVMREKN